MLDELNRQLRQSGLWFPVDVSTSSRATIGGMAGNNSCGTRSIRYGIMRDNVLAIDAILADGSEARFGEVGHNLAPLAPTGSPSPWRGGVRGGGIPTRRDPPTPAPPRKGEGTAAQFADSSATCSPSAGARRSTSPTPSPRCRAASAAI